MHCMCPFFLLCYYKFMKRICIFSLAYYPTHVSGAEAAVREITDRIDDIEFELITHHFDKTLPKQEKIGNVLVHRVGVNSKYISKILFIPMAALKAKNIHREKPFDGLWALMTYMTFPIVLLRFLGVKLPYVITLQDGDPYEKVFERWFIKPVAFLLDYGFKNARVIQVISSYLATWPKKRGSNVDVELIHNGANPRDFISDLFSEEEINEARNKIGVFENEILTGNTARLVYQKGWEDLIESLKFLPENVKLLVVGGGPEEKKYKDLAKDLNLDDRVIFIGQVTRDEVTKYRRMLDIFVMPSRSEGLGNAGLSAMASNLPLIATQEGGLAEYVFDKKNNPDKKQTAWVVEKNSPKQIANAVKEIMDNPAKVKEVVKNANEMVNKKYHWDMITKEMREKVFEKLFKD